MSKWTIDDALETYHIREWGDGFFDVGSQGTVICRPRGDKSTDIDVHEVVTELVERGIELPLLLRFPEIAETRIERLAGMFKEAIESWEYKGRYRPVYPIKVNQQHHLVADLVSGGRRFDLGLEAGSKPELLVAMAMAADDSLLICNGYKDAAYIRTALYAQRLGLQVVIVVEKLSEVAAIVAAATDMDVTPTIGLRAKLSRHGKGRWKGSSGDRAKFGLTAHDLVNAVDQLRAAGMLGCLKLLHFHIGSQVTSIRTFKDAFTEASRIYVELASMGAPMGIIDVGGGLGVDYDGSRSSYQSSMNYTEREYAEDVLNIIGEACTNLGLPHPDVVTESGRATVAHQSVLVFDVRGVHRHPTEGPALVLPQGAPAVLDELKELNLSVNARTFQEAWHDLQHLRESALHQFNLGLITLSDLGQVEHLYWQTAARIYAEATNARRMPDDLRPLGKLMADTYYCNFSLFQSAPDAWAIDQLFPCMPIHRLDTEPTRNGILADLTCDSDGKLDRFIGKRDIQNTLPLHEPGDEPYMLGLFLVGAYQEILGDLHNLFGDTNAVHLVLDDEDGYDVAAVVEGDSVHDVLRYVQYDSKELIAIARARAERQMKRKRLTRAQARELLEFYRTAMTDYTYLSDAS